VLLFTQVGAEEAILIILGFLTIPVTVQLEIVNFTVDTVDQVQILICPCQCILLKYATVELELTYLYIQAKSIIELPPPIA
jgi:hypothetical protein